MRRLLLSFAALAGFGVFAAPAMANGPYRAPVRVAVPLPVERCEVVRPLPYCAPPRPVVRWEHRHYYDRHARDCNVRHGWHHR